MIIVEGADNVGKSTLIQQLVEQDPRLRLLHRDRFKPQKGESIGTSYLTSLLPADGDRLSHGYGIMDRFLASEIIYGDLFRGGHRLTAAELDAIRRLLVAYDPIVVHCDPGDDAILASWKARTQLYDDPLVIVKAYRERLREIFVPFRYFSYDHSHPRAAEVRTIILNAHRESFRHQREALSWWSLVPHGAGNIACPEVILIGESPSPRGLPGVPFSRGPAAQFLAECLEPLGVARYASLYVTNAVKGTSADGVLLCAELNRFLITEGLTVITLGTVAQKALERLSHLLPYQPTVINLPHPQFIKRFRWNERGDYANALRSAVQRGLA